MVDFIQGHHHFSPESVIKKLKQVENVSTIGDIIHDRTRFRGSEYLVWLGLTEEQIGFFLLSHIFEDIWREVVVSFGERF